VSEAAPTNAGRFSSLQWAPWIVRPIVSFSLFAGLFFGAWHAAVVGFGVPPYLMPVPLSALEALVGNWPVISNNLWFTLSEAAVGLAFSVVLALFVAGLFVTSPTTAQAVFPFAISLRSVPVVAIAPIVTLLVGRGFWTGVTVVTIASFFPILVNCLRGFMSAPPQHLELMHLYAAKRWQVLAYIRFPFAFPFLFSGLRTAAPIAVLGAMLSEWLTGTRGLGYLILDSAALRELELLWATMIVSMMLGLTLFWMMAIVERHLLRWRA